jgi:flavin reductase (DIM6/NTAB) family NADH-FMN oxidoreductase RutF
MDASFERIGILDNFYQTSSFFPMPVVLVSTVSESGQTNLGPYSLCFPFVIADEGRFSMMLAARSTSITAKNIKRTGLCAINFIIDDKKCLENCLVLGFPGEGTDEKMKNSIFTLVPSMRSNGHQGVHYPDIVEEAVQVF